MSTPVPASLIYSKIIEVMSNIGAIGKDRKNEQQGYKFRGIEDIYNAVHPIFAKCGVFCVPQVTSHETTERVGKTGTVQLRVVMTVDHRFYATDGSYVTVTTVGEGMDTSDKASNKAMSAAMKYAFVEMLSLPFAEVEDGDRDSPEAGTKRNGGVQRSAVPIPIAPPTPKEIEREPGSDDGLEEQSGYDVPEMIDLGRQRNLHMQFRDSLKNAEAKKMADTWLEQWLKSKGFVEGDRGSAKMVPLDQFDKIRREAIQYAASLPK